MMPQQRRARRPLLAPALSLLLLLLLACWPLCALAQSAVDDSANSLLDPTGTNAAPAAGASSPPRSLLFRPAFDSPVPSGGSGSPSPAPAPFPSSATRALESPFPLHVSLDALGSARFTFSALPSLPVGAALVGFDWRRNGTVATLQSPNGTSASASYGVDWSDSLPSWLRYIAPSGSAAAGACDAGSSPPQSQSQLSSPSNAFTVQVTAPQSGDRSKVYESPPPVLLHFVAVVQYQYPPPLHPHDDDSAAELDEDADASAAAAAGSGDSSAASSSSASSSSSSSSSPLVLVAEVQCASLLVSLTLLPPFAQRAAELAPFYTMRPSPNMLDPRNRLANARSIGGSGSGGGSGGSARTKGLGSKKFSWRDEVVFACAAAPGLECSLCTPETVPSSSAAQLGSVAPFPSLCLFISRGAVTSLSGGEEWRGEERCACVSRSCTSVQRSAVRRCSDREAIMSSMPRFDLTACRHPCDAMQPASPTRPVPCAHDRSLTPALLLSHTRASISFAASSPVAVLNQQSPSRRHSASPLPLAA